MKEKIMRLVERLRRVDRTRIAWYAGLAVLLTALGAASYGWRSRAGVRYERQAPDDSLLTADAPLPVMAGATAAPTDFLTALPAPTPEPLAFDWPLNGEILRGYAPDALSWSETLGQWETHPGIDIAAAAGEAVRACADGVVADAYEDPLWGRVIRIEHAQGYATVYANLSTLELVRVGDEVRAGQAISAVGQSAGCESEMPWHLHFSVEKDGESVNFEKIVRQSAG